MSTILHITHQSEWLVALKMGSYVTPTLAKDGFIHCSTAAQALRVANAFFTGQTDLILLVIDTARLVSLLKFEGPVNPKTGQPETGTDDLFPHVYGALNIESVTKVVGFPPNADGTFSLPEI